MPRRSINFPDKLYKELQIYRGNQIASSTKGLSFSKLVVKLVEKGLESAKSLPS